MPTGGKPRRGRGADNAAPNGTTVDDKDPEVTGAPKPDVPEANAPGAARDSNNGVAPSGDAPPPAPGGTQAPAAPKKKPAGDFWWKCWRCGQPAKVFCVDCKKGEQQLCHACCAFEHEWNFKTKQNGVEAKFHSMEAINPKQTTSIILALADALVLPLTLWYFIRRTGIPEGYNDGVDVCPLVDSGRSLLFSIDAGLSLFTKHYFQVACNVEDGYIRLWVDVFVRCIATNTDSFFLLMLTAFRASLFHTVVVRAVFVPVAAIILAIFSTTVHFLTLSLPALEDSPRLAWFKGYITRIVDKVQPPAKRLPNTFARERPSMQYKDWFWYNYGRIPRRYRWFKEQAGNRVQALSQVLYRIPICIRCCCIFLKMGWVFKIIAKVVVPDSFWVSGLENQVSKDEYSGVMLEALLQGLVKFAWRQAPGVCSFVASYTPSFVGTIAFYAAPLLKTIRDLLLENYLIVLAALTVIAIPWLIRRSLKAIFDRQKRNFDKEVKDDKNNPFAKFEAQVKWMGIVHSS